MRPWLKIAGWLLLLSGWAIVIVGTLLVLGLSILTAGLFTPDDPIFSLPFLIGGVCGLTGYALIEGKKDILLFLRPFGHAGANVFSISLLTNYLRKRYRVMSLDDGNVPGPPRGQVAIFCGSEHLP